MKEKFGQWWLDIAKYVVTLPSPIRKRKPKERKKEMNGAMYMFVFLIVLAMISFIWAKYDEHKQAREENLV